MNMSNPLQLCTSPPLPPSSFRDNPAHPSPLNRVQERKKDKCLQYQQTLI